MEGRDFGKLKKGYFKGTKANTFRYQIFGIMVFVAGGFTALRLYYADRFFVLPKLEKYFSEDNDKMLDRRAAIAVKRIERMRAAKERDDGF